MRVPWKPLTFVFLAANAALVPALMYQYSKLNRLREVDHARRDKISAMVDTIALPFVHPKTEEVMAVFCIDFSFDAHDQKFKDFERQNSEAQRHANARIFNESMQRAIDRNLRIEEAVDGVANILINPSQIQADLQQQLIGRGLGFFEIRQVKLVSPADWALLEAAQQRQKPDVSSTDFQNGEAGMFNPRM